MHFDFAPLLRSSIGFEDLNRLVDYASNSDDGQSGYPPYNIEKISDDEYRISVAAAGFSLDDLDISVKDNILTIAGRMIEESAESKDRFIHRGIASRAFERRFQLADTIRVLEADFKDGLLSVNLQREIPEHKKPRKIEISSRSSDQKVINSKESSDSKAA